VWERSPTPPPPPFPSPSLSMQAAYTFDAGPNAVIYTTAAHAAGMLAAIKAHFPPTADLAK
jgi:mevalonate pyrophosphate decarboxylase